VTDGSGELGAPPPVRRAVVLGLGRPQERRLLAACRADPRLRLVARCSSAAEVLATLRQGGVGIALLDEDLHLLDDDRLAELEAGGFRAVVLSRDPDGERWRGRRVQALSVEAEVTQILLALDQVARGQLRPRPARRSAPAPAPAPGVVDQRRGEGRVFVFWGGSGSPGRTTLTINWGALLGSADPTIVLDLDLTGAAVAAQLDDAAGGAGRRGRASPNLVQLASVNP
jgi:hypothetical protein